jgi:hypothetical protein
VAEKRNGPTPVQGGASCLVMSSGLIEECGDRKRGSGKERNTPTVAEDLPFLEVWCVAIESAGFADEAEEGQQAGGKEMRLWLGSQHVSRANVHHTSSRC